MPRNKRWFRFYNRMIDSPQVLELSDSEFRLLVSLWCLASEAGEKGAVNYTTSALRRRVMPHCTEEELLEMIAHLKQLDLLAGEDGSYEIPRWEKHQYEFASRIPENRSDLKKKPPSKKRPAGRRQEPQPEAPEEEPGLSPEDLYRKKKQRELTPQERLFFRQAEETYGSELILEAIHQALKQGKTGDSLNLPYIAGILRNWQAESRAPSGNGQAWAEPAVENMDQDTGERLEEGVRAALSYMKLTLGSSPGREEVEAWFEKYDYGEKVRDAVLKKLFGEGDDCGTSAN